jgi:hypothetical protein
MADNFYEKTLYPLQDVVLYTVKVAPIFYLTGGTALSRFYCGHRYSDDLDFFTYKNIELFDKSVDAVIFELEKQRHVCVVPSRYKTFIRGTIDNILRVDFVSDEVFRYGELKNDVSGCSIDNPINILANKLTALSRYAGKDIVDIWAIAKNFSFSWKDIWEIAEKKAVIDIAACVAIIKSMPQEELNNIRWVNPVDTQRVYQELSVIAEELLLGRENSLKSL